MQTRTFTEIEYVNRIWVESYTIKSIESFNDETLVITGDRGYPNHLRIDIKFIGHQYLACPTYMDGEMRWRMATEEEAVAVWNAFSETPDGKVYCIEEDFSRFRPHPNRAPYKFFIVAARVEVTVSYGGDDIDDLLRLKRGQADGES